MNSIKLLISIFLISLISIPLFAGEVVEVTTKDLSKPNEAEKTMQFYFLDGLMKIAADEDSEMVFNSEAKNMMVISHSNKSYMIFDQDTASDVLSELDKVMEQALAKVPPEQRAMVEKMMKQGMPAMGAPPAMQVEIPKAEIRNIGRSDTINGYDCDYYEMYKDDQKEGEFCVASWSEIGASDNIKNSFKDMSDFMEGFLEQFRKMAPTQSNNNPFSYMKEMDGYPVLSRQFSNGVATQETILTSITEQDIDQNIFSAPEGYNKQDMMGR